MVNFLTSPDEDCRFRAGWTLEHIVSEEEAVTLVSTEIVTSFCDMPDALRGLTDNAVIKRVLIQKGALPMLIDRVWEADSDDSKRKQGTSQRQRAAMAFWLFHAPRWFPDLHNKTYFIPPLDPDSNQNGGDTTAGRSPQVYRHHFCFMEDEMDEAIDALVEAARAAGGQLYVLIDEAGPPKLFPKFCQQLVSRVPTVHLWATALEHGLRPACLTEVRLTIPYRCPWAVLQEISASRAFSDGHVYQYDQNVVAAEEDGTRMKYMKHKNQRGHTGHYPLECDETRDEHGNVTSQASGLVRGLRARGVPVQVVRRLDPDDVIRDVALAISNKVTVADYTMVAGLERRVVVGMGAEGFCSYSDMLAMSRSSGHLLWIDKAKAEVRRSFLERQSNS
nr:hypothetical protein BaRGS_008383 [Batillaria attramentaria]